MADSLTTDAALPDSGNQNDDSKSALIMVDRRHQDIEPNIHEASVRHTQAQSRRSPRKKSFPEHEEDQSVVLSKASSTGSPAPPDKPVLKLFLKSSDSTAILSSSQSTHNISSEKNNIPTMLRLRFSSSEDKAEKVVDDKRNLSSPHSTVQPSGSIPPTLEPNDGSSKERKQRGRPKKHGREDLEGSVPIKAKLPQKPRSKKDAGTARKVKASISREKTLRNRKSKKAEHNLLDDVSESQEFQSSAIKKPVRKKRAKAMMDSMPNDTPSPKYPDLIEDEVLSEAMSPKLDSSGSLKASFIEHDDICTACRSEGPLILCASCPSAYHSSCVFPPVANAGSDWRCYPCRFSHWDPCETEEELIEAHLYRQEGIDTYQDLWNHLRTGIISSSSSAFNLPKRLRPKKESQLSLELLDDSAYQVQPRRRASTSETRKVPAQPNVRRAARSTTNALPAPAISSRISETGQCHYCGQRSIIPELLPQRAEPMVPRPLIHCDYCHLLWHPDCIDPPLTAIPPGDGKWVCPAHVNLPIHPNYIPEVELENGDPFDYEIALRLASSPPAKKYLLPESSIILDFGMKIKRLRGDH